jgi:hypothetical protein
MKLKKHLKTAALSSRRGMIILTLVIVTTGMMIIIALALAFSSLNASESSLYQGYSSRVFFNIDGCAEEGLAKLNRDNNYSGETMTLESTVCTITLGGTDPTRIINVTATNGDYTRTLQINVTIFPTFTINSWQELAT